MAHEQTTNSSNEKINNDQSVKQDNSDTLGNEIIHGPETIKELNKLVHHSKLSNLEELLKRCLKWR